MAGKESGLARCAAEVPDGGGLVSSHQCLNPAKHEGFCGVHGGHKPAPEKRFIYVVWSGLGEVVCLFKAEIVKETAKQIRLPSDSGSAFWCRRVVSKLEDGSLEYGSRSAQGAVVCAIERQQRKIDALDEEVKDARSEMSEIRKLLAGL